MKQYETTVSPAAAAITRTPEPICRRMDVRSSGSVTGERRDRIAQTERSSPMTRNNPHTASTPCAGRWLGSIIVATNPAPAMGMKKSAQMITANCHVTRILLSSCKRPSAVTHGQTFVGCGPRHRRVFEAQGPFRRACSVLTRSWKKLSDRLGSLQ